MRVAKLFSLAPLQTGVVALTLAGMTALPETKSEAKARTKAQLKEQKVMLENLPKWLKQAGLSQKDVANALGVSECTVSKWVRGLQAMSVGQLRQIAVLLNAKPSDLLRAPDDTDLTPKVEETLKVMDQLSDAEWEGVMAVARSIAQAKQK